MGKADEVRANARRLEAEGDLAGAVAWLSGGGLIEEGAGLLAKHDRHREAATLLFDSLGVAVDSIGGLPPPEKKRALLAASYFSRAGEARQAAEIYLALGERPRAAEVLERSGDRLGAARVRAGQALPQKPGQHKEPAEASRAHALVAQGKFVEAARLFEKSSLFMEAGLAWRRAADAGQAMTAFMMVSSMDPKYREAALQVVELATALEDLSFEADTFLGPFLAAPPDGPREMNAFYQIGLVFERLGFPENAREAFNKLVSRDAGYKDAGRRLMSIEASLVGDAGAYEDALEEEAAFLGKPLLAKPLPAKPARKEPVAPASLPTVPPVAAGAAEKRPGAVQPAPVATPGAVISGRYRLDRLIGTGGMSEVFAAFDLEVGEAVALKLFSGADAALMDRFRQELRLTRKLTHPNVVRVHDIGIFDGRLGISMELLSGKNLEALLRDGRPPVDMLLDLLGQACNGLQAAHAQGVVHRDVKPENLFVTDDGQVKVMDFGIAKGEVGQGKTVGAMLAGTWHYIAPEQINNFSKVTPAADVYALGAVAYRAFAGVPPFNHQDLVTLLMMHVNDEPLPLRKADPSLPEALEAVVMKCLEKDPMKRCKDAGELAYELSLVRAAEAGPGLAWPKEK